MKIADIKSKEEWDAFVTQNDTDSFLHSWNWGEFNRNTGEKIWRFGFYDGGELRALALVIKVKARRGTFLFVPHGPVVARREDREETLQALKQRLIALGREEKAAFVRISPAFVKDDETLGLFRKAGFRNAPVHMMHPEITWILDISRDEETLLREMKKNHRNLIRRAAKDGVTVSRSVEQDALRTFYDIHMETVQRHGFVPFSFDYIRHELECFKTDDRINIFNASYQGKVISSAIVVFYGNEAFYHHGASSSENARIPSSYLALWEAIREAKRRGLSKFNFYGIVENKPKHPWYGLSHFKKGFGGYETRLVHCQDLPLGTRYYLAFVIETVRKIKRGY